MRDPRRIRRILALLQQIWEYQQDVRFNQLVSNMQSIYSQQHDNYGKREVFERKFIDLEKSSYLDFFFLEDDKWEGFLTSYLSSIESEIEQQREKIDDIVIDEVIELFINAGVELEQLDNQIRNKLEYFFLKESRWLTVEAIVNLVRNFSQSERKELFEKVKRYI